MSDPSYNTPTYRRQQGSVFTVDSGGTLQILAGGSIQNAGGVSLGAGVSATNITLGGTTGKWSFGTATMTNGVGTLGFPGFTRVMSANANPILGEASGNGSTTGVQIDMTLAGAGSVIFRVVAGTLQYAANVNIAFQAFGT